MSETEITPIRDNNISAGNAWVGDPVFKISRAIVFVGLGLGMVAKLAFGREFNSSDPVIGKLLSPLSFIWFVAFFLMFWAMLKTRLSMPSRIVCRLAFLAVLLIFGKVLFWDSILELATK